MSVLGGVKLKDAVKFFINHTMSNGVQQKFNWEGKQCWRTKENEIKRGFKSTATCMIMISKFSFDWAIQ